METIKIAEEMNVKKIVLTCLKRELCGRDCDQGFALIKASMGCTCPQATSLA
jgi:hypothetical protein